MRFLNQLYVKYYNFQVKIGNADVAPYSSMLIIALTIMLYYFSAFFFFITLFPIESFEKDLKFFMYFSFSFFFLMLIVQYFQFLYKRRYKKILMWHEMNSAKTKSYSAVLFPLIAFILFNLSWILKLLQNQGNL